ncbi:N-6 DNA methylase [Salinibaculum rarum]|uniref:N-6 DNA methylase n=1 Tax=Salinibaculum rarum TaxID=3058903 RepID=UPI00265FB37F|nr:N-6 DNA methylase [Salinibaculum sp. KK48]
MTQPHSNTSTDDRLSAVNAIKAAADNITAASVPNNDPVNDWIETHGLSRNGEEKTIIARQAAFTVCLRFTYLEAAHAVNSANLTPEKYRALVTEHAAVEHGFPDWFLLDELAVSADSTTFTALSKITSIFTSATNPSDTIGGVYEELVGHQERWRLGQFRTPPVIAETMASLGIEDGTESVLAPGLGAGALAYATAQEKDQYGNKTTLSDIHGIDTDPLSLLMGGTAFALSNLKGDPSLICDDFFGVTPALTPDTDVVISNPPYTRHHELTEARKSDLNEQISTEANVDLSMLSPLSVYFTVHATQFLEPGGTAVFLTPADLLTTDYGEAWKRFLLNHYAIDGFLWFDQSEMSYFDDARTTSLVTVATRCDGSGKSPVSFVDVTEYPGAETLRDAVNNDTNVNPNWGDITTIDQEELTAENDWDILFNGGAIEWDTDLLVPFNELGRVSRGIATGQNSFFCLSESDRCGETKHHSWTIDESVLAPVIRQAQLIPHYDYRRSDWEAQRDADKEVWLLYYLDELRWDPTYFAEDIRDEATSQNQLTSYVDSQNTTEKTNFSHPDVIEYLKAGMRQENPPHETHLASNRNPWYRINRRDPAPILYTSMTRGQGRFIHNKMGARNLNNLHSLYLDIELSETELEALLAYLNSDFAIQIVKQNGRTLSSGMDKVEPGDLDKLPVIDPRKLPSEIVKTLASEFDDLCEAARSDDHEETAIRQEIRTTLSKIISQ